jgi:cell division initiation protein
MEITPRELRDVEIAEAFRGYNREIVNDLLERAAATVDASSERVRELAERLKAAQLEADRSRETEDILHRTLLLAQRAADEAVAEAQQKARAMMEEAELESHKLLAEAQTEAQQRGDEERERLEGEVIDLAARRDTLLADVDTLTQFETDYRDRLAAALEQDLEALRNRTTAAPGPVPEVEPVELPVAPEAIARSEPAAAFIPEPEPVGSADAPESFTAYTPGLDTDTSASEAPTNNTFTGDYGTSDDAADPQNADAYAAPEHDTDSQRDATAGGHTADASAVIDDNPVEQPAAEPTYFEAETFVATAYAEPAPGISEVGESDAGLADAGYAGADTPPADAADAGNVELPTRQVDMTALFDAEAAEPAPPTASPWEPSPTSAYEPELDPPTPAADAPIRTDTGFDMLRPDVLDAEVLDDDAFFATLREAVHDDTPLGPRDEQDDDADMFGEGGERSSFRDVFRRRR